MKTTNPRRIFLSSLVVLLLLLPGCGPGIDQDARTKIGDKMPALSVETPGGTFSLAAQTGRVVLVNFWATWCGPCQVEMPELEKRIWRKYKSSPDFTLIAIAREQDRDTVIDFRKTHADITFPLAWDPTRTAFSLVASGGIPRIYVIDRQGIIVYQGVGYGLGSMDAIDRAIEKALAEK